MSQEQAGHIAFRLTVEGFPAEDFSIVDFKGREAMNELFSFRLRLVSEKPDIMPEHTLARSVTLTIESSREGVLSRVPYHGVFSEFRVLHQATPYTFYEAVLVPKAHLLTRSRISEVYTSEKGIPDILEDVLKAEGFSAQDYAFRMRESYRSRSFVCQYEESHISFIDRWSEREGIAYYFDHEDGKDRIVFFDHPSHKPSWNRSLSYRPSSELDLGFSDDSLQEWSLCVVPLPHRVVVSDFNYRKANLEIEETRILNNRGKGTLQAFGRNLRTNAEAQKQATVLSEIHKAQERTYEGKTTAIGVRAATTVHLKHHFREDHNGTFFVTSVVHEGSQAAFLLSGFDTHSPEDQRQTRYVATLTAIPSDVAFRSGQTTLWPKISGMVSAIIEAEGSGLFAELNEYGEYKVRFPFIFQKKRSQKNSGWVRMSTPLAGADNGMHFPLHKETEVMVAFLGGDPDQPVILGAVHNSEHRSLITNRNPAISMIRAIGGNILSFNDEGYT